MSDINMEICKCGRIHFYSNEVLDRILDEEKELVLICSHCGMVKDIGANKEPAYLYDDDAEEDKICYNMYSWNQESGEITADNFNSGFMNEKGKYSIGKIIISDGVSVMMETGYNANGYQGGAFYDNWYPDFLFNHRPEVYNKDFNQLLKEWEVKRKTVSMPILLRQLTEDQAELLSGYCTGGLNWKGTKWEREWNSR